MGFEIIDTQEKLDAVIADRLRRERETVGKKYADYEDIKKTNADYEKQIGEMAKAAEDAAKKYAGYDKQLAELQSKLKGYETNSVKMRIAHENGIPYELAERLSGETEDDIRKDAESLSKYIGKNKPSAPLKSTEPTSSSDAKTAALRAFTAKLTSNE